MSVTTTTTTTTTTTATTTTAAAAAAAANNNNNNNKARVIPSFIGAVVTIPRGLQENLRTSRITMKVEMIHKVALLGTARILRKVPEHGQRTVEEKRFPGYEMIIIIKWCWDIHCESSVIQLMQVEMHCEDANLQIQPSNENCRSACRLLVSIPTRAIQDKQSASVPSL